MRNRTRPIRVFREFWRQRSSNGNGRQPSDERSDRDPRQAQTRFASRAVGAREPFCPRLRQSADRRSEGEKDSRGESAGGVGRGFGARAPRYRQQRQEARAYYANSGGSYQVTPSHGRVWARRVPITMPSSG